MKNSILYSIIFLFTVSFSFADEKTSIAEKLQMIKERPLLVEIPSINTEYIEKLKEKGKTEDIEEYTKHYNEFVENYKKAFTGFWTYNKEIHFKTYEDMVGIINQNTNKYAIIKFRENGSQGTSSNKSLKSEVNFGKYDYKQDYSPSLISSRKIELKCSTINLYMSEQQNLLFSCRLPVTESLGGIVYTLKQFDFIFELFEKHPERRGSYDILGHNFYESEVNLAKVKESVLFIKKEDLDESVEIENLSKYYMFNYKIVTNEEWESAILLKKTNIVCAILLPGNYNSKDYYHMFFLASNGKFVLNIPHNFGIYIDDLKTLSKMAK